MGRGEDSCPHCCAVEWEVGRGEDCIESFSWDYCVICYRSSHAEFLCGGYPLQLVGWACIFASLLLGLSDVVLCVAAPLTEFL